MTDRFKDHFSERAAGYAEYRPHYPPALADYLVSHQIRYARAIYWDAYAVDFLARERVIVASVDLIRIPDYQRQVDDNAASAYNLPRIPCVGDRVASWCIQRP